MFHIPCCRWVASACTGAHIPEHLVALLSLLRCVYVSCRGLPCGQDQASVLGLGAVSLLFSLLLMLCIGTHPVGVAALLPLKFNDSGSACL